MSHQTYWKKFCGIERFKIDYYAKHLLYRIFGITLPKLKSQHEYWARRGHVYMDEILASGYLERELFFQNMLIDTLKQLQFESFFEAGCGFGWNIKRVQEEFPTAFVAGVDFSLSQLENARRYLQGQHLQLINADNCQMPLKDNAFDIGFSLGVFMNIHPASIEAAVREMTRVCRKYIIHLEYDQTHTTAALREKRAFKTNIVSHDYRALYESLGKKVVIFKTYQDFGQEYSRYQAGIAGQLDRWEGFEGAEKYIFIVVEV